MAAPCTEHLFLTGEKGVGKSTLVRLLLEGKRTGGFFTRRVEGVMERPSVHLLRPGKDAPGPENLLFYCGGGADWRRFDELGCAALAEAGDWDVLAMDELGPHEAQALRFRKAVLETLDGGIPVVGVLQRADSEFLRNIANHPRVRVVEITRENRDEMREILLKGKFWK